MKPPKIISICDRGSDKQLKQLLNPRSKGKSKSKHRKQIDVNVVFCDDGNTYHTPLIMACTRGKAKCVELLLAAKADVNVKVENNTQGLEGFNKTSTALQCALCQVPSCSSKFMFDPLSGRDIPTA